MKMSGTHTIYLVEDDEAICKALEWLFTSVMLNTRVFHNASDFLKEYSSEWQGCLLLDVRMPQMSGIELQERLSQMKNKLPIIFITGHGDIPMAVRAMKQGAFDFITKPFDNQELLDSIQKAIESFTDKVSSYKNQIFTQGLAKLTMREKEVMQYVAEGVLNKQIASALGISLSTVEMHRSNLMQKLGVKSLAEFIKSHTLLKNEA